MMQFAYKGEELCLQDASSTWRLSEFCKNKDQAFYLYHLEHFKQRAAFYRACLSAKDRVHFAMKANSHPRVLKAAREAGLGLDLVSGGELEKAFAAGFAPDQVIFSGVGKSSADLKAALKEPISQINVESPMELERIAGIAKEMNRTARVAFRYNPNVSADTHPYIRTGFKENKFGMDESFLPELTRILQKHPKHLKLVGLSLHIGSQILNVDSLVEAVEKTLPVFNYFKGLGQPLESFDVGGGVGISYEKDEDQKEYDRVKEFFRRVHPLLDPLGVRVFCEPGRFLIARAGMLFTQVEYVKRTPYKNFVIVNTGMHHLMRPSLYKAYHRILPLHQPVAGASPFLCDVVGPVCESSDVLGYDRSLPRLNSGDWLVVLDVGAYGAVMASDYNSFPRPPEFFIEPS